MRKKLNQLVKSCSSLSFSLQLCLLYIVQNNKLQSMFLIKKFLFNTNSMPVYLNLYSVLCPTFSDVPANKNASNLDVTGGHFAELNTSYQTNLVDPTTDLPAACQPAPGLTFDLR